jgi:hypothetical protein
MVLMVDSTDHVTGRAGATLTVTLSKAGTAFGSISPTIIDRGAGWYSVALLAADLDTLGDLALHITAASCDPSDALLEVVAYDPGDAAALGLSRLDTTVGSRSTLTQAQILSDTTPFQGALIDAAVSTRAPEAGGNVAAIKAKTDNLPASPAAVGSAMTLANDAITSSAIAAGAIGASEAPLLANLDATVSSRASPGASMTLTAGAIDDILDDTVEGTMTLRQAIRILMSVAAGETTIVDLGGGAAEVTFKSQDGTIDRVYSIMAGSERTSVTVNGG